MQSSAMPCHAALLTRSQPILKQARRWASKPEKNENRKGTRAAYCLLWPGEERRLRQSHPIHKTPPKQTITSYQREKEKPQKPRLRKVAPVFKKRPGHSARSSRKQSTQVTPTMMSCLEATGSAAKRLRAHAADTAAGLAHTGLALSAAPAGR